MLTLLQSVKLWMMRCIATSPALGLDDDTATDDVVTIYLFLAILQFDQMKARHIHWNGISHPSLAVDQIFRSVDDCDQALCINGGSKHQCLSGALLHFFLIKLFVSIFFDTLANQSSLRLVEERSYPLDSEEWQRFCWVTTIESKGHQSDVDGFYSEYMPMNAGNTYKDILEDPDIHCYATIAQMLRPR